MYTEIKGINEKDEEINVQYHSASVCFGVWSGMEWRCEVKKIKRVSLAKFGFHVSSYDNNPDVIKDLINKMETIISLCKRISWFPQSLEAQITKHREWSDKYITVSFQEDVDMAGDKLIWCFKIIRELYGYSIEKLYELKAKGPEMTLLTALLTPSKTYGHLSIRYDYDWDDSNIHWPTQTAETFDRLLSLEEPHWQQEPFFNKDSGQVIGYKKSHMLVEDYEWGDDPDESEYTDEEGLPIIDKPLMFGLSHGEPLGENALEDFVEQHLGDIL